MINIKNNRGFTFAWLKKDIFEYLTKEKGLTILNTDKYNTIESFRNINSNKYEDMVDGKIKLAIPPQQEIFQ